MSWGNEATDFHDKEISKACSSHTCLAVINIGSVGKKYENCYWQAFLKECKYSEKEKKWLGRLLKIYLLVLILAKNECVTKNFKKYQVRW